MAIRSFCTLAILFTLQTVLAFLVSSSSAFPTAMSSPKSPAQQRIEESMEYYTKIARGTPEDLLESPEHITMAARTYMAHRQVKIGKSSAAERIYRRLVKELASSTNDGKDCDCDFGRLAIPTLLLALLLQREKRPDQARAVFESFYDMVVTERGIKCSCSARVMQAFALFEMKQENPLRAVEIVFLAIRLDKKVRPVLKWKQFRTALALREQTRLGRRRDWQQQQPTPV